VVKAGECGCALADEEVGSCYCVLEPLVQAVGRRHALPVLNVVAARGGAHFNEIQEQLNDLSSSTLAVRLQELESVGLIVRAEVEEEGLSRSEYRLTAKGRTLRDSLRRLFPKS
jgi:DNA-binding HxlR family transcriptional regulator